MKTLKALLLLSLLLMGTFATESAFAHRGRVVVGVGLGFGFPYYAYGPYYPYYPYYPSYYYPPYYPAPVVVQQQPSVYVEQPQAQPSQPSGFWYYCADSRAYYPYVKECPAGWQRVAPQPQH